MTKLRQIRYYANDAYIERLTDLAQAQGLSVAQFVQNAVELRAEELGVDLGVAKAPHGVRSDALPVGWKSRLYRDMHQLVCQWGAEGFTITPFHQFHAPMTGVKTYTDVIGGEKVELYVLGVDEMNEALYHDLALAVLSWITDEGL